MLKELKAFLLRGDVVGLAVAVIIAGAFGRVVGSLVDDILSPLIGMLTGNPDFSSFVLFNTVRVGAFLNAIINFIFIGVALFFIIKAASRKPEEIK
jgi:Large-conductance mechanosensitive channel